MNWKFEKEFRKAHPETIGETDKLYDYSNYVDWLESELVNKNDLLQRVMRSAFNEAYEKWYNTKDDSELGNWLFAKSKGITP